MMLLWVIFSIVSCLLLAGAVTVNETGDMWFLKYPSGAFYAGEMNQLQRHGVGNLQLPDGKWHFGEWRNDQMHGLGFETYSDGSALASTWDSDELEGPTFYLTADETEAVFAGNFETCSCVVSGWIHHLSNGEVCTPLSWKWLVCFMRSVLTLSELQKMTGDLKHMSRNFQLKMGLLKNMLDTALEDEESGDTCETPPERSLGAPHEL
jgi:hypothetical protein